MKYLAIDYGKKRIGLAVGEMIPRGAGVLDGTKKVEELVQEIGKLCQEEEIDTIVMGMPLLSSGDPGVLAPEIEKFANALNSKLGIPVEFEPEELTSFSAEEILKESGKNFSRQSGKKDELAAVIILEQYLSSKH